MPAQQPDVDSAGPRWRLYLDVWNLLLILIGVILALVLGPILN